ncbi:pantoate--beta-alanine ligase [bacterium]|nr:pantoate--beta-alanine ligase [bacterium]MBU1983325.1 pantoate--beta-alanine ligase [bacterium]
MRVVTETDEIHRQAEALRAGDKRLSFVPTMGALHEGHLALVRLAHQHADRVAVSIFVNPLQFGPREDFRVYPRTPEEDCERLEKEGVDLVFMPTTEAMYPSGWTVSVHPGPVGGVYEGKIRPGHFQGVLTVVAKLFHIVDPDVAVFGEKDAQQLFMIRRMVEDLDFRVKIIAGETVRESDGLALSSRNAFLTLDERAKAPVLYRSLQAGRLAILDDGVRTLGQLQDAMRTVLAEIPELRVEYSTAVCDQSFSETDPLPKDDIRLIVAGRFSTVRLIDNLLVSGGK